MKPQQCLCASIDSRLAGTMLCALSSFVPLPTAVPMVVATTITPTQLYEVVIALSPWMCISLAVLLLQRLCSTVCYNSRRKFRGPKQSKCGIGNSSHYIMRYTLHVHVHVAIIEKQISTMYFLYFVPRLIFFFLSIKL